MNRKGLSILMRTKMRPLSPAAMNKNQMQFIPSDITDNVPSIPSSISSTKRNLEQVRDSMHSAILMNKTEILDSVLSDFSEGYFCLSIEDRRRLLIILAREYDFDRTHVQELMNQYLGLELPAGDNAHERGHGDEWSLSAFYRIERNLRLALKPNYEVLFERLNTHPGGLKFLSIIRADILSLLTEENVPSLRALDSYLKDKLSTWLSPANLELHNVTWDDPASLLEKIVAYEAVHPISNLLDLKRRLGVGRRCFGYLHPTIPGEPLIFIEVALMKNVAETIQEVLRDDPPIRESEATCALFYSISSTQPGLSGINLGKFLIKRVIDVVKKDMPYITVSSYELETLPVLALLVCLCNQEEGCHKAPTGFACVLEYHEELTFATLSPIPGYMQWLLSKLASAERSGSSFRENLLKPEEEKALLDASREVTPGKDGMEVMLNVLTSINHEWTNSADLIQVLRNPLMRLCARYLLKEKKRGKALDSVTNFHLQNGAMIGKLNWMADRSQKGLGQSGGIMVNYIYRMENIEENAQSYYSQGHIQVSSDVTKYLEGDDVPSE